MDNHLRAWFDRRTFPACTLDPSDVLSAKNNRSVSVVIPARNEASTIGLIVKTLRSELLNDIDLVDEILVIDSRSSDATARIAADEGATVYPVDDWSGQDGGKGAAMMCGLNRMRGDIGVYLDADIVDFGSEFVVRLLRPILSDPSLILVKGFYDRPWTGHGQDAPIGGGRVTELVARPLIAQRAPQLSAFVQPLAGECAFRRDALLGLPFVSGYGVDVGILLEVLSAYGLNSMAQVDLGSRLHTHQDLEALGRMALQVAAAFELCIDGRDEVVLSRPVLSRGQDGRMELSEETTATWIIRPA